MSLNYTNVLNMGVYVTVPTRANSNLNMGVYIETTRVCIYPLQQSQMRQHWRGHAINTGLVLSITLVCLALLCEFGCV